MKFFGFASREEGRGVSVGSSSIRVHQRAKKKKGIDPRLETWTRERGETGSGGLAIAGTTSANKREGVELESGKCDVERPLAGSTA